jgi:hypothetical protein
MTATRYASYQKMYWNSVNWLPKTMKTSYRYVVLLGFKKPLLIRYECSIPVFDGLFLKEDNRSIGELLFLLATWHAYAKLRLHTDTTLGVTVSPSPQSKDEENEKLHKLRRYARDFWRQHTTDAERFNWDLDDEDYGLAIGRLVVT